MKSADELARELGAKNRTGLRRTKLMGKRAHAVELGRRLREQRERHKLTAAEVARELGLTRSMVSSYENGIGLPSLEIAAALVWFYGTTFEHLAGHMMPPQPEEGRAS